MEGPIWRESANSAGQIGPFVMTIWGAGGR